MEEATGDIMEPEIRRKEGTISIVLEKKKASTLTTLPYDICHLIMKDLDIMDSACLGLTNKQFWAIHKSRHPTTNLRIGCGPNWRRLSYNPFADRLKLWMAPDFVYSYRLRLFVTREKYAVMEAKVEAEMKKMRDNLYATLGPNCLDLLRKVV
ncbi:hypothetical protein BKA65DRAFT_546638 [Rhexocercosporidium sp. MPI-PUGE-AT-0058]|nr:hypothetical protein BKA65DRAFT_546638 [Rhexocercosporidium sp. MPI-PUGE-AT-0058]